MMILNKIDTLSFNSGNAPVPDEYAKRMVAETKQWARFAQKNSSQSSTRLNNVSLEALAFSFRHRSNSLAIPTKLVGTRALQDTLAVPVRIVVV